MDLLDRIRTTTVADLANVRSDFDDDKVYAWTPKQPKNMVRIVEGADDLKVSRPAPKNPGMVRTGDWSGNDSPMAREARCLECGDFHTDGASCGPVDRRTEAQIRYMDNLISWITEKDANLGAKARAWTDGMTGAGKWDGVRDGNISDWIDRLKAKNAELNDAAKASPVTPLPVVESQLPVKTDKGGKPMPLYYAVDIDGVTKFYRIKPGRKDGFYFIDAQASDELHQVRNATTKAAIVKAIIDAGPEDCMARYGQLIGSCGRCGRTLTDAESRARGIGPDCWGKM